jgi:hypothetical protein
MIRKILEEFAKGVEGVDSDIYDEFRKAADKAEAEIIDYILKKLPEERDIKTINLTYMISKEEAAGLMGFNQCLSEIKSKLEGR